MFINCHSYYSLRRGTYSIKDLIRDARTLGAEYFALTDINSTAALFEFYKETKDYGNVIGGIEFRDANAKYTGIALNNDGLYELNTYLSSKLVHGKSFAIIPPVFQNAITIIPSDRYLELLSDPSVNNTELMDVMLSNDNLYLGLLPDDARKFQLLNSFPVSKMLVWQPVFFQNRKENYVLHKALRAIDKNCLLSMLPDSEVESPKYHFVSTDKLRAKYEHIDGIFENTARVVSKASIDFRKGELKNKKHFLKSAEEDFALLEKLARDGMNYRYGPDNEIANQRIEKELSIIEKLGFSAFFLITHDIIRYARSKGYYHVGRGSGANSVVAYCMQITDVCPIELDLYFERFINPHRSSPPDFDLDFSWDERSDVIDYIFKKYGQDHVAQIATYNTFQGSSIIRELGKVYGLPKNEIDAMVGVHASDGYRAMYRVNPFTHTSSQDITNDAIEKEILALRSLMEGFPNYLGIHAGGMIISDAPLTRYTALEMMPKGFPICHWDMHIAEEIGYYKYDILSQRGLGHIKESIALIKENHGVNVDIHDVRTFFKDERIKERLRNAETIGCFYIESPAMRQLLTKLQCDNYLTLVAASSIIRPGVAGSGMMDAYIERHNNPQDVKYLHPKMKELLEDTFGVMVYQEDVIKVVHHFGGIDLADADVLRRAMGGKRADPKKMEELTRKYFDNCRSFGYDERVSKEVWRQVSSFAGFSFSKAHSASYAVESYQSLFLKTYYPIEFMVAVINNFGGFYQTEFYVHEAKRLGATIEAPCVNNGRYLTSVRDRKIYLGFNHLKNLSEQVAKAIVKERANGPFTTLEEFMERVRITREDLTVLIRIDALRSFGESKKNLMWQSRLLLSRKILPETNAAGTLFSNTITLEVLPELEHHQMTDALGQIELLGFPLVSRFDLVKELPANAISARQMSRFAGREVVMIGVLVTTRPVRTRNGKMMGFGCFIDREGDFFDSVHFSESFLKYPFAGTGCYALKGRITEDFGTYAIDVSAMEKMELRTT